MDAYTPASEIADAVRSKKLSAREATEAALKRVEAKNPALNALTYLDPDRALRQADAIDEAIARGEDPGSLAGVPMGVKDLEGVEGMPLTMGSLVYKDQVAFEDSVQVSRLRRAGAVFLGKTNTPEFGYKGFTANRVHGATGNPWDPERTPGGSSGGSAAAVAAGMVPLCTGSDGGGSIRAPSAFSGCYGIKPSAGRIPRAGLFAPHWGTHSTVGPISWSVRDAARYLDAAAGPHPNDLDSLDAPPGGYEAAVVGPAPRVRRIAWTPDLGYAAVDSEVKRLCGEAAKALGDALGADVEEVNPGLSNPMPYWYAMAAANDTRTLDSLTPDQRELLEPGFVAFADQARQLTALQVMDALEERHQLNRAMTAIFEAYDLLVTPAVACTAFPKSGPPPTTIGGVETGPAGYIAFTPPFNMTGHPAASVPAGLAKDGLPVGLQVIAPRHADAFLLAVSAAYEAARPWRRPPA